MTAGLRHRLQGLPGLVESAVGFRRGAESRKPARFGSGHRRLVFASLATAAAAILAIAFWPKAPLPPAPPPPAAAVTEDRIRLTQATGDVRVITGAGGGTSQPVAAAAELRPGDTLRTTGAGSSAVLTYADGTRLVLVNDSSLTCLGGARKSVVLHAGTASVRVAPQPAGSPMLLATPGAKVEVVGTRFAIAATTERTELNVSQGRVRLTRVSDGQTVDVAGGQSIATNGEATLVVHETAGAGATWAADFEDGPPKGWRGEFVTTGLPPGSRGAMKAVFGDKGNHTVYEVATREQWVEGLFVVHDDLHLHITLKMERPEWLNVFFASHGADGAPPPWALHLFNEMPFSPREAGRWRTVTIPLSKFKRKRDGAFRDEPPVAGEVVHAVIISATEPDRGLVIDRMWITRGGPGVVESKPLP
jgi:ferric-dicitrate binding protein FerR (iron transport regulator)